MSQTAWMVHGPQGTWGEHLDDGPWTVEELLAPFAGWQGAYLNWREDCWPSDAEQYLLEVSRRERVPLLGCYVQVSDFGYVVGLLPGEVVACYVVNPRGTQGWIEGGWALAQCAARHGAGWRRAGLAALARWSRVAPRPLAVERLEPLLAAGHLFPGRPLFGACRLRSASGRRPGLCCGRTWRRAERLPWGTPGWPGRGVWALASRRRPARPMSGWPARRPGQPVQVDGQSTPSAVVTRSTRQIPQSAARQIPHNAAQASKRNKVAYLVVEREERAVARVRVSLAAFRNGALPPVCAKTGEPADRLLPVRASYTPRWTWLLLPFGGFWAFLIARGFTTEETMGLVPFSQAALTRWRVQARSRLGWAVLGALLLLVVLYRIAWPFAFFGGCVLVAFLFGFAWVSLLGGGEVGAHFDPGAPTVLLWGVHERFKQAVEEGQQPDPNVRYWQTQ